MKLLVDKLPTNPHECPFYKARGKSKHIGYPHCSIDELVCCPPTCQHLSVINNEVKDKKPIGFQANNNNIEREDFLMVLEAYIGYRDDEWTGDGFVLDIPFIKQYMEKYNISDEELRSIRNKLLIMEE